MSWFLVSLATNARLDWDCIKEETCLSGILGSWRLLYLCFLVVRLSCGLLPRMAKTCLVGLVSCLLDGRDERTECGVLIGKTRIDDLQWLDI